MFVGAVMKRTALALQLIVVVIVTAVAGIQFVSLAKANWVPAKPRVPSPLPPTLSVMSPENRTYDSKNVTLNFAVNVSLQDDVEIKDWNSWVRNWTARELQPPQDWAEICRVSYYLDGVEHNVTVPARSSSLNWSTTLEGLSEGTHTLTVNASGRYAATVWVVFVSPTKPPLTDTPYKDTAYSSAVWSNSEITFTISTTSEPTKDLPEFPSWTPLTLSAVVVLAVGVIYMRRVKKNQRIEDQ